MAPTRKKTSSGTDPETKTPAKKAKSESTKASNFLRTVKEVAAKASSRGKKKSASEPDEAPSAETAKPAEKSAAAPKKAAASESGRIEPMSKRPAYLPPVGGGVVYAREREPFRLTSSPMTPPPASYAAPEGSEEAFDESGVSLPSDYGQTMVSALVRDPDWIFVFWELSERTRSEFNLGRGQHERPLIVRLYDVTDIIFDGENAHATHDVPVNDYTSSWYVRTPQPGRNYVIDLATYTETGEFKTLARSGVVTVPKPAIGESADHETGDDNEVYRQILRLSGGESLRGTSGSEGFSLSMQQRFSEALSSEVFSGALFSGGFSGEFASGAMQIAGEKGRNFWLEVGVEVIVYGRTEPDASVKFMGRRIRLRPDGTFGIRMALPDGQIDFPVEATSADGVESRYVCPIVKRHTEGDPTQPIFD